jgi:hypothetical protein
MINWRDESAEFQNFTEKDTQQWRTEGFSKEEARAWLEVEGIYPWQSSFAAYLENDEKITPPNYQALDDEQQAELMYEYHEWIEQFVYCAQCEKRMNRRATYFSYLSNRETDIHLCSADCQTIWFNNEDNLEWLEWGKVNKKITLLDLKLDFLDFKIYKKLNFNIADYQEYRLMNAEEQRIYKFYTLAW